MYIQFAFPGAGWYDERETEGGRDMKKRLTVLLMLAVLAVGAVFSARADGQIRVLPIDLSGGAPFKARYMNYPEKYEDPTISVEYHHKILAQRPDGHGYYYFYAIINIADASQLRTAAADPVNFTRGRRMPAVDMARRVNAVFAINGDFCNNAGGDEDNKYCLRQGTVYRDTVTEKLDMLLIDEDGDFHIYKAGPELATLNKEEIDGKKIINAFQFGPALVVDGEPVEDEYILDRAHAPNTSEPDQYAARVCIAQIDTLTYLVVNNWYGLDLASFRDLVMSIAPCKTVYVLDGGNSGQMIYLKSHVNENANNIRTICDIIYFASAYFEDE